MKNPADKRIKKTYQSLFEAMLALLEEKTYEEITVIDICKESRVHRATFYKHFEDKNSFFAFCIEMLFKEFFPSLSRDISLENRKEYFFGMIDRLFTYIDRNREMVKTGIFAAHSNNVLRALQKAVAGAITGVMEENAKRGLVFFMPVDMLGEYYAGALIALVQWWLFTGTDVTKDEVLGYVENLIDQNAYVKQIES